MSKEGIEMDLAKVEAMMKWPYPTTVTEVRSFLGIISYYCSFIQDFAKITAALTKLTQKGQSFIWDRACERRFLKLNERLVTSPVLIVPDATGNFAVYSGASIKGLGCMLM